MSQYRALLVLSLACLCLTALKPGSYPFIGEYHEATAKGRIIAE